MRMFQWARVGAALVLGVLMVVAAPAGRAAAQGASDTCEPSNGLSFICGIPDPEDIDVVPGGRWVVVASSAFYGQPIGPGRLVLIDVKTRRPHAVPAIPASAVARVPYKACPSPPPVLSPHGISMRAQKGGAAVLYVVNHGRESVEVFQMRRLNGSRPTVDWIGCVKVPAPAYLNSVAPMADGGLVVSSLADRTGPEFSANLRAGRDTGGRVYRWTPGQAAAVAIPGTDGSGANGVAAGPDGVLYVSYWGAGSVRRLQPNAAGYQSTDIPLGFNPDNLKWWPTGELAIGGQQRVVGAPTCALQDCRVPGFVALLEPGSRTVRTVYSNDGQVFSNVTTGLRVGRELWLGSVSEDRIAIVADFDPRRRPDR